MRITGPRNGCGGAVASETNNHPCDTVQRYPKPQPPTDATGPHPMNLPADLVLVAHGLKLDGHISFFILSLSF
jgi:hypothetical protein